MTRRHLHVHVGDGRQLPEQVLDLFGDVWAERVGWGGQRHRDAECGVRCDGHAAQQPEIDDVDAQLRVDDLAQQLGHERLGERVGGPHGSRLRSGREGGDERGVDAERTKAGGAAGGVQRTVPPGEGVGEEFRVVLLVPGPLAR